MMQVVWIGRGCQGVGGTRAHVCAVTKWFSTLRLKVGLSAALSDPGSLPGTSTFYRTGSLPSGSKNIAAALLVFLLLPLLPLLAGHLPRP